MLAFLANAALYVIPFLVVITFIVTIHELGHFLTARACGVAVEASAAPDALWKLTAQQRQIVHLAAKGHSNRDIADRLFLSPRTVSSHLYRSYPKLGVAGRNQLRDVIDRAEQQPDAETSRAKLRA